MSLHTLVGVSSEVSAVAFVLCAVALALCSVLRERRDGRAPQRRRRLSSPRLAVSAALVLGALAGAATMVRLLATAFSA